MKVAVFKLEVLIEPKLENAFIDYLRTVQINPNEEINFCMKHGLSVRELLYLEKVFSSIAESLLRAERKEPPVLDIPTFPPPRIEPHG